MPAVAFDQFRPSLFRFLKQLDANNNRDWFQENKHRYEAEVREPALAFIAAIQPKLTKVSPHFQAIAKRSGGSLMRVYRDTRFSKDKIPYKTNVGIHFRHEMGKDVHAPGYYVHLEPNECFLGIGLWRPEPDALRQIRQSIDEQPTRWKRARDDKRFGAQWVQGGDRLKSAPRGYDKDHPLIEDLKRKDFVASRQLSQKEVLSPKFLSSVIESFRASNAMMRFLCDSLKIPF